MSDNPSQESEDKYGSVLTEKLDPSYHGIDTWPDERVLRAIYDAQLRAVNAVGSVTGEIAAAASDASMRLKQGHGRLIYIGAGTSARLGVQDGTELTPTYGWPESRLDFAVAGGPEALLRAVEGAEDHEGSGCKDIDSLAVNQNDVCIALSASGSTPYTLGACKTAKQAGAITIGFANNRGAALLGATDHGICLDSGPEPVAGSTRMSAGTAQKVALNMLSTLIMIRLGHVYDGYMVDMIPTNSKLKARAVTIVAAITGCSLPEAGDYLSRAHGRIKNAVLIARGVAPEHAENILEETDGDLRKALNSL